MTSEVPATRRVPGSKSPPRTRRNPFLVALRVVGIVFLVVGTLGFAWSLQLMGGRPDYEPDATFLKIANGMQPVFSEMVLIGLATLVGVKFLKLRRRDSSVSSPSVSANPRLRSREP